MSADTYYFEFGLWLKMQRTGYLTGATCVELNAKTNTLKYNKRVTSRSYIHGALSDKCIHFSVEPSEQVPEELRGTSKEAGWVLYRSNKIAKKVITRESKWLRKKDLKRATSKSKRRNLRMSIK